MPDSPPENQTRSVPAFAPALMSDEDLGYYFGTSARLVRQMRAAGQIPPPVQLPGRLTRWRKTDIDEWLAALPQK